MILENPLGLGNAYPFDKIRDVIEVIIESMSIKTTGIRKVLYGNVLQ